MVEEDARLENRPGQEVKPAAERVWNRLRFEVSYGWEIQLTEAGFLAIFLCPLVDGRPFPRRAPPLAVLWLFRWLIFRIMLGAGLIKIRGDPVWRDLTALNPGRRGLSRGKAPTTPS